MKMDTTPLAAVAEDGHLNTSTEFGVCWIAKIEYNTHADGSPVAEVGDGEPPCTLHGPFETPQECADWLNIRIDGDIDVAEAYVLDMNKVRP